MAQVKLTANVDELLQASSAVPGEAGPRGTTGRFLVLFEEGASEEGISALNKTAGLRTARATDFGESAVHFEDVGQADALAFPELGVAVVSGDPTQMQALRASSGEGQAIAAIEPERIVYAFAAPAPVLEKMLPVSPQREAAIGAEVGSSMTAYLVGYRAAVNSLVEQILANGAAAAAAPGVVALPQTQFTWGLQETRVHTSRLTGRGVRVAVLDTGLDLRHPDFANRAVTSSSFIPGEAVQDGHGHGTHCIGTACGPKTPANLPRYGVAFESNIFAGKVLSNSGSGADAGILAGINWAVANGCSVVSMSLGAAVQPGQSFSTVYETVARRALSRGTLIVAAAGNDSNRGFGVIRPVSHPANCPSILAVGAVDSNLRIANFSNRGLDPNGGRVDLVGPGVDVISCWPAPTQYRSISGTSMATPHVAGIAALYAQQAPTSRGAMLWVRLVTTARNLPIFVLDDGWGLVQAQ